MVKHDHKRHFWHLAKEHLCTRDIQDYIELVQEYHPATFIKLADNPAKYGKRYSMNIGLSLQTFQNFGYVRKYVSELVKECKMMREKMSWKEHYPISGSLKIKMPDGRWFS